MAELLVGYELEFLSELPMKKIKAALGNIIDISSKSQKKRDKWQFKHDGSLRSYGTPCNAHEICTPAMPPRQALKVLNELFNYLALIGADINDSCGLHVNVGFKDKSEASKVNREKLVILTEDEKWAKEFKRQSNTYCVPFIRRVKEELRDRKGELRRRPSYVYNNHTAAHTDTHAKEYLNPDRIMNFCLYAGLEKYDAINRKHLRYGYVEFRMLGNKNYHLKFEKVKAATKEFCAAVVDSTTTKRDRVYKRRREEFLKELV